MAVAPEIRRYFDSVVVVDDKLDNPLRTVEEERGEGKTEVTDQAVRLFQTLQNEGYIISPFRFKAPRNDEDLNREIDRAVMASKSAKMLVLDWRLDERYGSKETENPDQDDDNEINALIEGKARPAGADTSDKSSLPAREIIRKLLELPEPGMKYVVVYTSDTGSGKATPFRLVSHLNGKWIEKKDENDPLRREVLALMNTLSTTEKFDTKPIRLGTLLIAFMDKKDEPAAVMSKFTEKLGELSGPLSLAFLGAVGLMEREAHRALASFADPLDVPVFMHIGHNSMDKTRIGPFLMSLFWDYLVDGMDDEDLDDFLASLEKDRLQKVKDAHKFATEKQPQFRAWCQELKGKGLPLIEYVKWEAALARTLALPDLDEIRDFLQGGPTGYREEFFENKENLPKEKDQTPEAVMVSAWSQFRMAVEVLLAYLDWKKRGQGTNLSEFVSLYQQKTALFTRLLTGTSAKQRTTKFRTGDIFRGQGSNSEKFLLCITPYCDTALPSKISYHYKFLVGRELPWKVQDIKGKGADSEHISVVPIRDKDGQEQLVAVQWDFYQTEVWKLGETHTLLDQWKASSFDQTFLQNHVSALTSRVKFHDPKVIAALEAYGWTQAQLIGTFNGANDPKIAAAIQTYGSQQYKVSSLDEADRFLLGTDICRFRRDYGFAVQLKKEYAQQVLNKYLMYHSRAGVPELYYKERPGAFVPLLKLKP